MANSKRFFLSILGGMALQACSRPEPAATIPRGGVLALDWALAETLVALGKPPAGVVAVADWPRFVVEPALPATVADLGLQQELNLELMAALRPDLILVSPFLAHFEERLRRIAPVMNLSVYEKGDEPLGHRIRITRELADHVDAMPAAESLVQALTSLRQGAISELVRLQGRKPIVFASFVDHRHARVYAGSSLYAEVLAWLGLENAWERPVGYFGFSTVGIEALASVGDAELVVVEPVPPDIRHALSRSPIWAHLPLVRSGQFGATPPVFMFGGLPSAERMVRLLLPHLLKRWG